jgi:hypothetical protein
VGRFRRIFPKPWLTAAGFDFTANSEDRGYIQPGVQVANSSFPEPTNATPYPEASIIGIGKDFYAISTNLPDGTPL